MRARTLSNVCPKGRRDLRDTTRGAKISRGWCGNQTKTVLGVP